MEQVEVVSLHEYTSQLYCWWNNLSDSWKDVFHFHYLKYKEPQLLEKIVWDCREMVGSSDIGWEGVVDRDLSLRYTEGKLPQIIFHALHAETILDCPWGDSLTRRVDNTTCRIENPLAVEDSSGLKQLRKLKTLNFYARYGEKQPMLNVTDLMNLNELQEINLDVEHSLHLQDILLLNLPNLKRIHFLTHIDAICHWCVPIEYLNIIDSLKEKTKITIELQGYMV